MDDQQLQTLVEKVSLKYFQRPFKHQAYFNRRLKTTGGRYHLKTHNIDFNPKMAKNEKILLGIIKHELVHYHLHLTGHSGKHNTQAFKKLLHQVGGSRYAPRLDNSYKYLYICTHCGQKYYRKRRIDVHRFLCGKCTGKLKLVSAK